MFLFDVFIGCVLGILFLVNPVIGFFVFMFLAVFTPSIKIVKVSKLDKMQEPLLLEMMETKLKISNYSKEVIGKYKGEDIHDHLFVKDDSGNLERYNFKSTIAFDDKGRALQWPSKDEIFLLSGLIYEKENSQKPK